jgi:PqqD family protein of HPr-rel-A system
MAGIRYRADPTDQVRLVDLDGLTALFHRPSGMTHILAAPAPQILKAIADRPGTLPEILSRLAQFYDIEGTQAELQPRLEELVAAGLVWRDAAPREAAGVAA